MRRLAFAASLIAAPALAQPMPPAGAPPVMAPPAMRAPMGPGAMAGQWRPHFGARLPRQWAAPRFFVSNWGVYGLPRPAWGYGWSRYDDDAVLTDRWGRVYAWRDDVDWDGRREHRHHRHHHRGGDSAYVEDGRWDGEWRGELRPHWVEDGFEAGDGCGCITVTTTITQPTMILKTTRVVTYETVREPPRRVWRPTKRVPLGKRTPL